MVRYCLEALQVWFDNIGFVDEVIETQTYLKVKKITYKKCSSLRGVGGLSCANRDTYALLIVASLPVRSFLIGVYPLPVSARTQSGDVSPTSAPILRHVPQQGMRGFLAVLLT